LRKPVEPSSAGHYPLWQVGRKTPTCFVKTMANKPIICPMDCVTQVISMEELAWGLYELNMQSPGSRGFHRYQIIQVVRDGTITEVWVDMGLAKKWRKYNEIRIPSLLEHTVGELVEMANDMRENPSFDIKELVLGTNKLIVR